MRTDLEVALRDPEHANWPEVATRLLAENERLGTLVDDLLELARLDEGRTDATHAAVDIDELVLADVSRRTGAIEFDTRAVSGGRVDGNAGSSRRWCGTSSTTRRGTPTGGSPSGSRPSAPRWC